MFCEYCGKKNENISRFCKYCGKEMQAINKNIQRQYNQSNNPFTIYINVLEKYAVFNGRARRKEFWLFGLVDTIISAVLVVLAEEGAEYSDPVFLVYLLATILPTLAVSVRRLHDIGKSWVWLLIQLIPVIGIFWFIILAARDGVWGDNEYGPDPKANERITPVFTRTAAVIYKKCPYCAEQILIEAAVCRFCGHALNIENQPIVEHKNQNISQENLSSATEQNRT